MTPAPTAAASVAAPRLELLRLCKAYGGVPVIVDVSFDVKPGEVHGLVGENGAGKTTIMNMISGVVPLDSGEIRIDGQKVNLASPRQAQQMGVATVFQELSLVPALSIAENIFGNRAPTGPAGVIRWAELYRRARALLGELGVSIEVWRSVASLSPGTRQLVEIAKALSVRARLLLLDEPTSALAPPEVDVLFGLLKRLRASGMGIIYISHRISEVLAVSDRISVLRDGRKIGTWAASDTNPDDLVRHMVGRRIGEDIRISRQVGAERLRAVGLGRASELADVSFALHSGEIVAVAGLMGSGRSELGRMLVGDRRYTAGRVLIDGRPIRLRGVRDAINRGIVYLPADRKAEGLFLTKSVADNIIVTTLERVSRFGILSRMRCAEVAGTAVRKWRVRAADIAQPVMRLSGGNQQKVLLGKWLLTNPQILIADDPTRGVDVGAKHEIHAELDELARTGTAILLISSDLPEILTLSDRVLVMCAGRLIADLARSEASEKIVMALAAGLKPEKDAAELGR
jgi:ABC-type sugar transport system ATPase subunit